MKTQRMLVRFGLSAALLLAGPSAMSDSPSTASYERGMAAVESYRYAEALMHFQQAAEQGERDARRNLGLMLLYGDRLYGKEVPRSREQARRWLQAAAADGCDVSVFMLQVMAQHGH